MGAALKRRGKVKHVRVVVESACVEGTKKEKKKREKKM